MRANVYFHFPLRASAALAMTLLCICNGLARAQAAHIPGFQSESPLHATGLQTLSDHNALSTGDDEQDLGAPESNPNLPYHSWGRADGPLVISEGSDIQNPDDTRHGGLIDPYRGFAAERSEGSYLTDLRVVDIDGPGSRNSQKPNVTGPVCGPAYLANQPNAVPSSRVQGSVFAPTSKT